MLTIGWVIFLGVAAAAGLTRILPIGSHKTHVAATHPSASALGLGERRNRTARAGRDSGRSEPTVAPGVRRQLREAADPGLPGAAAYASVLPVPLPVPVPVAFSVAFPVAVADGPAERRREPVATGRGRGGAARPRGTRRHERSG